MLLLQLFCIFSFRCYPTGQTRNLFYDFVNDQQRSRNNIEPQVLEAHLFKSNTLVCQKWFFRDSSLNSNQESKNIAPLMQCNIYIYIYIYIQMFPQMSKTLVTRTSVNFYLHFEILCFVSLAGQIMPFQNLKLFQNQ